MIPVPATPDPPIEGEVPRHRLGFVGIGASGRTEPIDIRRERAELAAKKFAGE